MLLQLSKPGWGTAQVRVLLELVSAFRACKAGPGHCAGWDALRAGKAEAGARSQLGGP